WWFRGVRAPCSTSPMCFNRRRSTPRLRQAYFIPARSPYPNCGANCARKALRSDRETGGAGMRQFGGDIPDLDWEKMQGLVPAVVQDAATGAVLMLGYMNPEALAATRNSGRVTFWSRSKGRLWTKGETSGHFLEVHSIAADCDGDTLLLLP